MSNAVKMTYRQAITEALREEMLRDSTVIILGEDVGRHGGARGATKGLWEQFGQSRVIDTPISELAISGACVGASMSGLRPVVENFIGDIIVFMADPILTSGAKLNFATAGNLHAPFVIRCADASRPDGGPHQDTLAAWFAHIPGIKVVVPATPADAKGLLKSAIRDDNPVIVLEPLQLYDTIGEVPVGDCTVPIGKADIKAAGSDVTVVGVGRGVQLALEARERWEKKGKSLEVLDLRSLRPLDVDAVRSSVAKTGRLVVIHEGWAMYGISAEVLACVAEAPEPLLRAPARRVGTLDTHIPASIELSKAVLPNAQRLDAALLSILEPVQWENQSVSAIA